MTSRTLGVCLFVFCVSLFACKKKDKSDFVPRAGNYVLAGHYIAQDAVMYVAGEKITDKQLIEDFSRRNIWKSYFDPPYEIDEMVSNLFPAPGTYPTTPSSLNLTIDADGKMNFKGTNFPEVPDTTGRVVDYVGEYAIVEIPKNYEFLSQNGSDECPSFEDRGFVTAKRLDSIKRNASFEVRYFTERFPMRFVNGVPELYKTSILYSGRQCWGYSTMLNSPNPDIIDYVRPRDTVVAQIWALPFVRQ